MPNSSPSDSNTTLSSAHSRQFFSSKHIDIANIPLMNIKKIILRAELDTEFNAACHAPELSHFWEMNLHKLFGYTFKPYVLEGIDVFDQFRGQYYYNLSLVAGERLLIGKENTPNLLKATKYHSFDAIFCLLKHSVDSDIQQILELLSNLNPKNSTPALLLYAKAFFNSAKNLITEDQDGNAARISVYLDQAFMHIHLAEELYEKSSNSIHNTTYGLGLPSLFPEFTSFNDAKNQVTSLMQVSDQKELLYHISILLNQANTKLLETISHQEKILPTP